MTVTFSVATPEYVILGADAAVALDFSTWREYQIGKKLHVENGAIVTTWGARDANNIAEFLRRPENVSLAVDALAVAVHRYLRDEYRPKDIGLGNVGYHIGGVDAQGKPRLFHVFWEPDGYNETTPPGGLYEIQDQSPAPNRWRVFLYNGRSDLAHTVVSTLLGQIAKGLPLRFDMRNFADMWRFAHFVLRFAAELTPEVGPPFVLAAASVNQRIVRRAYDGWDPMSPAVAEAVAKELQLLIGPPHAAV